MGLEVHIAIVGGGPSGCYTAVALRKLLPAAQISIFDRRTSPFGLIRYGVAPDHQGMKGVARQFERLFASGGTAFFGGVSVGRDVTLEQLTTNYHAVVLATGLSADRPLNIPINPHVPMFAAGEVMRYLNADPDEHLRGWSNNPSRRLGRDVIIVGAGNVALDVARLLAKSDDELVGSDIDDMARASLEIPRVRMINILGRGPRERARWDASMFSELCALASTEVWVDGEQVAASDHETPTTISISFCRTPRKVDYVEERAVLVASESTDPEIEHSYVADSVITAAGFVAGDTHINSHVADDGRNGVVRIGGCASGVLGNLAENRVLAKAAAAEVATLVDSNVRRPGAEGIRALLKDVVVSYDDWLAIDAEERRRASPTRCRQKISSLHEIAEVVDAHRRATTETERSNLTSQLPRS